MVHALPLRPPAPRRHARHLREHLLLILGGMGAAADGRSGACPPGRQAGPRPPCHPSCHPIPAAPPPSQREEHLLNGVLFSANGFYDRFSFTVKGNVVDSLRIR